MDTEQDLFQRIVFDQGAIRLNKDTGVNAVMGSARMANIQVFEGNPIAGDRDD